MRLSPRRLAAPLTLVAALLGAACGPKPAPVAGGPVDATRGRAAVAAEAAEPGPIPVTAADPQSGNADALVTIVVFGDFECPFCARGAATLRELGRTYGPAQVRFVWKNDPLSFHKRARPAAEAAMAAFQVRGNAGFWAVHDALYGLGGGDDETALARAGVSRDDLAKVLSTGAPQRKVDEDLALVDKLGVRGTPAYFVNGVSISGAQPAAAFVEVIDRELTEATSLVKAGMPAARVYAFRAAKNVAATPPPKPDADADEAEDTTPRRVPVAGSPSRGPANALVTIVEFSDFQCPFCARVEPTLQKLAAEYGDKVRIVWKNDPLPFHKRAEPAAELALFARAQKGDAAFWQVHDLLFQAPSLEDADLRAVAEKVGLDGAAAMRAVQKHEHRASIEADTDLADDVGASGTPHFFVNGRRLVGAQPIERFRALVDAELARAQDLVKKGTAAAAVYDELQKSAAPPSPPPKVAVPPAAKDERARGPAAAAVTIHEFGDFACPYTRRAAATVDEVLKAFPGQVRVVWHDLPLPMHEQARPAAIAGLEAAKQKGPAGFWKLHDALFAGEEELDRAAIEAAGKKAGLDVARLAAALDGHGYDGPLEADAKAARAAGIDATPVFVVGGYLLEGAQPASRFAKVIRRALEDAKARK
jgi:protein-disulfide isomerase